MASLPESAGKRPKACRVAKLLDFNIELDTQLKTVEYCTTSGGSLSMPDP